MKSEEKRHGVVSTQRLRRSATPALSLPLTFSSSERRSASRYAVSVGRISASTQSRKRGVSDRHTFRDGVVPLPRPPALTSVLWCSPRHLLTVNGTNGGARRAPQRIEIRYGISLSLLHKLTNHCNSGTYMDSECRSHCHLEIRIHELSPHCFPQDHGKCAILFYPAFDHHKAD